MEENQIAEPTSEVAPAAPPDPWAYFYTEFRKLKELPMSMGDVLARRSPGFREQKCLLIMLPVTPPHRPSFIAGDFRYGTVASAYGIENATVFTVLEVINMRSEISASWQIGILDPEALAKETKKRKWSMEAQLNPSLIELARVAPTNKTLRAHLTSIFGTLPNPEEVDTFSKLRDWLEFECTSPRWKGDHDRRCYGAPNADDRIRNARSAPAPVEERTAMFIQVKQKALVSGICKFVRAENNVALVPITRSTLSMYISDGSTVEQMVQYLKELAEANANSHAHPAPGTQPETTHSEYEVNDTMESATEIDRAEIENHLVQYIKNNYEPQESEEILERTENEN